VILQNEFDEILLIKSSPYATQSEEWKISAGYTEKNETPS